MKNSDFFKYIKVKCLVKHPAMKACGPGETASSTIKATSRWRWINTYQLTSYECRRYVTF